MPSPHAISNAASATPWHGIHHQWQLLASGIAPDGSAVTPVALDPYMLWALHTGLRPLGRSLPPAAPPQALEFVLETDPATPPGPFPPLPYEVPEVYRSPLPNGQLPRYVTLALPIDGLSLQAVQLALLTLAMLPGVLRLQMGTHRMLSTRMLPGAAPAQSAAGPAAGGTAPPAVVLAVLEDGCPFGHAALRSGAGTRVAALWDQSSRRVAVAPWQPVSHLGYGAALSGAAMQALLVQHTDAAGHTDEEQLYADAAVAMPHFARRRSHAASVIGLLAGASALQPHGRWPTRADPEPAAEEDHASHPAVAAAPTAATDGLPLVAVQLPREQVVVTSGRWLAIKALDGLRFLVQAARDLAPPQTPPMVVANLSYGGNAGAHDGSGMLESAIQELCEADPQLAVVLAAGNGQGSELDPDDPLQHRCLPSGVHGRQLLDPGQTCRFTLLVPPDKQFETYLEVWLSLQEPLGGGPLPQPQWLHPGEINITVTAPDGMRLLAGFPGYAFSPGSALDVQAGLLCLTRVSQSRRRSMALLVVAATQNSSSRIEAPAGRWQVDLHHTAATARRWVVDAWVERDDTTVGAVRPQAARLIDDAGATTTVLTDDDTLSHRCQHPRMLTVGALCNRSLPGQPWPSVSPYSAAGATPQSGPSFSTFADASAALPGMRTHGSRSGTVARVQGTSLAAPQVAGWLAGQCAAGAGTLDQIVATAAAQPGQTARRGVVVP